MTDHPKKEDTGNIVLIAKNADGYQTLLELVSLANTR
jgi:DNA polymerase III alpha subunit